MKIFSLFKKSLAFLLLVCIPFSSAEAASYYPAPTYLLKIDGHVYRQRNAYLRRAPASLTKMMTALVVMERCGLDDVVTVSRAASRETGSRIGLRSGQKFRVRDLLAATLIASANDACRALADHACGNQKNFVVQMNARARALGLTNTRFSNACGHDSAGLYSNAHDLARLAEAGMRVPPFAKLVARRSMRISTIDGRRSFYFRNKNRLIGRYPGAVGVKTGTTPKAGQCLVAVAERKNHKVLLVIMHSPDRWRAAPALLDAAFANGSARGGNVHPETAKTRSSDEALPEGAVVPDKEQTGIR